MARSKAAGAIKAVMKDASDGTRSNEARAKANNSLSRGNVGKKASAKTSAVERARLLAKGNSKVKLNERSGKAGLSKKGITPKACRASRSAKSSLSGVGKRTKPKGLASKFVSAFEELLKEKARAIASARSTSFGTSKVMIGSAIQRAVGEGKRGKRTGGRVASRSEIEVSEAERKPSSKGRAKRIRIFKTSSGILPVGADDKWAFPSESEDVLYGESEPTNVEGIGGGNGTTSFSPEDDMEALIGPIDSLLRYRPSRRQRSVIPDPMTLWGRELHKRPLLTHEQEIKLARRMEKGDKEARRIFIESNYRLVVSIAQKYRGCGVPLEDLIQAGNIGLIQAVDHYDWRQGTRFSTCAVMWIRQAILRAIDSHARIVRLSMRVSEQVHRIAAARQALIRELGRDPTIEEIARRVRLSKERVKELMGYMAQRVISIDDPVDIADGLSADEVPSFAEYLADDVSNNPEEIVISRELKQVIEEAIKELPDRTQQALKLRFGLEDGIAHTYDEIGYQLGLSRQRAMQLVQLAIQQLREHPKIKTLFP